LELSEEMNNQEKFNEIMDNNIFVADMNGFSIA